MKRRQFLGAAGIAGLAGLTGPVAAQGEDKYEQAVKKIKFKQNWKQRRLATTDEWPIEKRRDVPSRDADSWKGTGSFESAPWQPPAGWKDTIAADVDQIKILNHGAVNMKFDPATLATHELFEKKTGITIDPVEIGVAQANLKEQQILQAQKSSPHAMNVDGPLMPVFVQQGYLEQTDALYSPEMWESYVPALQSVVEWRLDPRLEGAHRYGFPNIGEATVGNLRTDLVEQQGIDPKRFQGEWTWDLLEETMKAFKGTDVYGYAYYAGNPTYLFYSFRQLLYQQGGRLVHDDGTVRVDTKPARTVLQKMREWREKGLVPSDVISYGEGSLVDLFLGNQLAYVDAFADFIPKSLNQFKVGEQYRAVRPPKATTGPNPSQAALVAPNATGINPYADPAKKVAALLYGDLRVSYPSQWWEFTYEGNISFMDQVYDDANKHGFVKFADVLGASIDRGVTELFPQQQAIFQRLANPFQKAITGDLSPKQATKQGQQFIDTVLGQ